MFFKFEDNRNNKDIYLLSGGRKKEIIKRAFKGYIKILDIDIDYTLYDLYKYENIFFTIAGFLYKCGFINFSNYYNKLGVKKTYKKIIGDIIDYS